MIDYRPAGRGPFAVKLARIEPQDLVLDIGCYNGHLERYFLAGKCRDFRAIDTNEEAIAFARARDPGQDRFILARGEELPFENDYFDKALFLDVMEHVEDERRTLKEIRRVMKPGGRLILSVPYDFMNFLDPDELTRGARNIWRALRGRPLLDHPKHRHYNEKQLRDFLEGFEVETVHKSGTPVFWGMAMFYNAIALPDWLTAPLRAVTNPLEDLEYSIKLPTGFNIMLSAKKR